MCVNSVKGQYIYLIIDDQFYVVKYEVFFDYEIEDGDYYMFVFFFCFYYESIKIDQVYVVKKVMIENNGFMVVDNIIEFILFYSCFKGMYIGKV